MPYEILYYPEVRSDDIPRLPANIKDRIKKAILERLSEYPERYGLPLRNTLKGYWKLRVGDYRVVYRIKGNHVEVYAIMHRKHVYPEVLGRIMK
jgi:mRNA interferase RelE/StbE